MKGQRRVVVTGMGIISPVGNELDSAWRNLLAGQSGIGPIDSFDVSEQPVKFAGLVKDFDPQAFQITSKDQKKMDPFIQYGVAASTQAIEQAGLQNSDIDLSRVGLSIGSGIGGLGFIEKNYDVLLKSGPRRISPFFIPGSIINLIAGHVSIRYGFQGPNLAFATACTTGAHSIGMAARCIAYGDADVMVAGGAEKASTPLGVGGFAAARALSTRNDDPQAASRPWDKDRDGFVLGDGAGVLVLESFEHAQKRGAHILAELSGFGMSGDAFHMTQPSEGGTGGATAMKIALEDAQLSREDISYINAHATSTTVGDIAETQAIKQVFKDHSTRLKVSSTKSMTGHLLGAAGAIEAIFSIMALRDQIAPPTINLDTPGEECDLDFVPHAAQEIKMTACISNSFGFGGTNGALVFQRI